MKQNCGICHDPPEDMVVICLWPITHEWISLQDSYVPCSMSSFSSCIPAQVTSCEHVFCKVCLTDYSASLENVKCPLCSKPLTVDLTTKNPGVQITAAAIKGYKSGILNRLKDIGTFCTSTKIDALVWIFFPWLT